VFAFYSHLASCWPRHNLTPNTSAQASHTQKQALAITRIRQLASGFSSTVWLAQASPFQSLNSMRKSHSDKTWHWLSLAMAGVTQSVWCRKSTQQQNQKLQIFTQEMICMLTFVVSLLF
jgi:hypothetical protein